MKRGGLLYLTVLRLVNMADVNIQGLDDLHRALQALPSRIEKNIMTGAMRAGLNVLKDRAKANVPVLQGALKKSIKVTTKSRFGKVKAILKAGNNLAWYAHIIEFGSGSYYQGSGRSVRAPYVIKAKEGSGLAFNGVIREQVTHPGIKPSAYMRRALDAGIDEPVSKAADYIRARLAREVANL